MSSGQTVAFPRPDFDDLRILPDAYPPPPVHGRSLRDLGRIIGRRGRLIALTLLTLNAIAFMAVRQITPRYTAEAELLVGPRQEQVVDLKAVLSGLSGDSDVVESEIQVLRSRQLARTVVQRFGLARDPNFNPSLRPPTAFGAAAAVIARRLQDLTRLVMPSTPAGAVPSSSGARDPLSTPVDNFLDRLDVVAKGRSRVLSVTFSSASPELSANVVNAVVDTYIDNQLRAKLNATNAAHAWLNDRVAGLRRDLVTSNDAVEDYRRHAGLVNGRDASLLKEEISQLASQLIAAEGATAQADARRQSMAAINPNAMGLREDAIGAHVHERMLTAKLADLREQADAASRSEIELNALQDEAAANRALYDRLLARAKETQVESGLQQPDASVVSRAEWPSQPSFPKPLLILSVVFIASCVLAALLVFGVESLDQGFSDIEEVEHMLGVVALGIVPALTRRLTGGRSPEDYVLDHPNSLYGEAIRSLYTNVRLSGRDEPRIVLVASALPGEGKSAIILSIARLMASCGKRVLMVDCDGRRPQLHKALKLPQSPGLAECLSGNVADFADALRRDPRSPAYLLAAGAHPGATSDMLSSAAMKRLLSLAADQFDVVLLDCAPVLAVSDARTLCLLADKTVLVARWHDTRRAAVTAALRQVLNAGGNVAGLLLSMVDMGRYARYSDGVYSQRSLSLYLNH